MKLQLKYKIAIVLLRLLAGSWRIKTKGKFPGKPAIIAFWHGDMLAAWKLFANFGAAAIISPSKDGEILTQLLHKWKYNVVRGSSSKDGSKALNTITELAKSNYVLITPDGPRGPNREFKPGAVVAGFRSGTPVYYCSIKVKRKISFTKSWDNFCLPLPFALILINFSDAVKISPMASRADIENIISELELKMNQ
ncbi:MAG: hypothetical protein HW421_1400 [Ignavibacteria bacterium]|nr:hypothetical protein [Ignavibacteria bacterium]